MHVTLPGLKDVIHIVVMMSSIWTFNDFSMIYNLTGGGPANRTQILPTLAYRYAIQRNSLPMGAATTVPLVPVFIVPIFFLARRMLPKEKGPAVPAPAPQSGPLNLRPSRRPS